MAPAHHNDVRMKSNKLLRHSQTWHRMKQYTSVQMNVRHFTATPSDFFLFKDRMGFCCGFDFHYSLNSSPSFCPFSLSTAFLQAEDDTIGEVNSCHCSVSHESDGGQCSSSVLHIQHTHTPFGFLYMNFLTAHHEWKIIALQQADVQSTTFSRIFCSSYSKLKDWGKWQCVHLMIYTHVFWNMYDIYDINSVAIPIYIGVSILYFPWGVLNIKTKSYRLKDHPL